MDLSPILVQELGIGSRRPRTYFLRVAYVATLVLVVWLLGGSALFQSRPLGISDYAERGRRVFETFVITQFWLLTFFAILSGADLFARDIRTDTLGLLALTELTPKDIVLGKWHAALAQSGYLLFCGLPILAGCTYVGGAGLTQVCGAVVATLSSVLMGSALAVCFSCLGRTMVGAAFMAMLAYLGCAAALAVPASMLAILRIEIYSSLHPIGTLSVCLSDRAGFDVLTSAVVSALLSRLILGTAARRLASPDALAPQQVRASREIEERERYLETASQNLGRDLTPSPVWDRFPLLWKEIRTRSAAQINYPIRLSVAGSMVLLMGCSLLMSREEQSMFFVLLVFVSLFLSIAGGSGLFTRDREARRWEALLGTPVTSRHIIGAKLLSGPCSPEGLVLLGLLLVGLIPFLSDGGLQAAARVGLSIGLFLSFCYLLSALASLICRSQRTAMLLSGLLVSFLLLSLPDRSQAWRGPLTRILSALQPFGYLGDRRSDADLVIFLLVYGTAAVQLAFAVTHAFKRMTRRT